VCVLLIFRGVVLRIDVIQPVDYEHVPVVSGERLRLISLYGVGAHGNVIRAQRLAAGFRYAQIFARTRGCGGCGRVIAVRQLLQWFWYTIGSGTLV